MDNYRRVEDTRLFFRAKDQIKARQLAYEAFGAEVDNGGQNLWGGIDLQSSFAQSDAWFKEMLGDAMALLYRRGGPDLFVTVLA